MAVQHVPTNYRNALSNSERVESDVAWGKYEAIGDEEEVGS